MEVREIMTGDPAVCEMSQSVKDAAEMMEECDCGAIPVVESLETKRLVGIITDRDIALRAVAKGLDPLETRVGDCMTADITFVHPDSTLEEVQQIMENLQVRRVPIVDNDQLVCGIVSLADIALARPDQKAASLVQEVSRPTQELQDAAYLS
jgi:CBS domain-containing protein